MASPYSVGDQALNVRRQLAVADKLLEMGHIPFCPLLLHFWHIVSAKPQEVWKEIDREILKRCDAVLRLDGMSVGADEEVDLALALRIPVYYDIKDIPEGKC